MCKNAKNLKKNGQFLGGAVRAETEKTPKNGLTRVGELSEQCKKVEKNVEQSPKSIPRVPGKG